MREVEEFWSQQTSSRHRFADSEYFARKALEHAALMTESDRVTGCIDLGCGAGELLAHFAQHVKVDAALDYSQSMLASALQRLSGSGIVLLAGGIDAHLPSSRHKVWVSSQAINQYLGPVELGRFLDMFLQHEHARALYLFDCIDPLRYALLPLGLSYRTTAEPPISALRTHGRRVRVVARRLGLGAALAFGLLSAPVQKLSAAMGFGYLPEFWLREAADRCLSLEIVGSRYYEYRYHVIMTKTHPA